MERLSRRPRLNLQAIAIYLATAVAVAMTIVISLYIQQMYNESVQEANILTGLGALANSIVTGIVLIRTLNFGNYIDLVGPAVATLAVIFAIFIYSRQSKTDRHMVELIKSVNQITSNLEKDNLAVEKKNSKLTNDSVVVILIALMRTQEDLRNIQTKLKHLNSSDQRLLLRKGARNVASRLGTVYRIVEQEVRFLRLLPFDSTTRMEIEALGTRIGLISEMFKDVIASKDSDFDLDAIKGEVESAVKDLTILIPIMKSPPVRY
jgi:hypothetical protein